MKDISLQLWTIQEVLDRSLEEAISLAAEIGYTSIETDAIHKYPHEKINQTLKTHNMRMLALHAQPEMLFGEKERALDLALLYGCDYLVCPIARFDAADLLGSAEAFAKRANAAVDFYASKKVTLAYHSHAHEFERAQDGRFVYDVLFDAFDPRIQCELDTYWTVRGGADLFEVMERYKGRIPLLHVKNYDPVRPETFVDMDDGKLDFEKIIALAKAGGTKHFVIEQDQSEHPAQTARTNYSALARLL